MSLAPRESPHRRPLGDTSSPTDDPQGAMTQTLDSDAIAYRLRHPTVDRGRRAPTLTMQRRAMDSMVRLAEEGYPNEACGLLIGTPGSAQAGAAAGPRVERLATAKNLRQERAADRYLLDPQDFMAADEAARRDGLEIVGIWHSHPDSPAWPSVTDLEAAWEGYSYVIVSIRQGNLAELRSWRLGEKRLFLEEPVAADNDG